MEGTVQKKPRAIFSRLFGMLSFASFLLILIASDTAIEYMKKGLRLCSSTVIPSLFPFMVISELIVSSGVGVRFSKIFAKPMRALFSVGGSGTAAYIMGAVCGFPIGASSAVLMYDRGEISKKELEHLLAFCNNPGSAFVISAVGVSLLGNRSIGIMLYICVLLSSLTVGFFAKILLGRSKEEITPYRILTKGELDVSTVTKAVSSSAFSMLTVCAYVVFFSALVGCLGALLSRFSLPQELFALLFGFFELSSGVGAASECTNLLTAVLLCALFLGWSGLSVALQIISVSAGRNISFKPYFIAKAAQGLICSLYAFISVKLLFPRILNSNAPHPPSDDVGNIFGLRHTHMLLIPTALMLLIFVCIFISNKHKSFAKKRKIFKKGIDKQSPV